MAQVNWCMMSADSRQVSRLMLYARLGCQFNSVWLLACLGELGQCLLICVSRDYIGWF